MNRKSPTPIENALPAAVPSEAHASMALRESMVLMAPVVRWLLRNGVSYGAFADVLKQVFVEAARGELERAGAKPTGSALSVLSGVHRKDVRTLDALAQQAGDPAPTVRGVPLASQVFTRWLTARRYRMKDGQPKPLPRAGRAISFESLARELSSDVHPRTVLDELVRLGLVRLEGDLAVPISTSFTPSRQLDAMTALFAANAADHLAAAVHNLGVQGMAEAPTFLEQSLFANGLSAESVAKLSDRSRAMWRQALDPLVEMATKRVRADAAGDPASRHRMRVGVYFYSEPEPLNPDEPIPPAPAPGPAPRKPEPPARATTLPNPQQQPQKRPPRKRRNPSP